MSRSLTKYICKDPTSRKSNSLGFQVDTNLEIHYLNHYSFFMVQYAVSHMHTPKVYQGLQDSRVRPLLFLLYLPQHEPGSKEIPTD